MSGNFFIISWILWNYLDLTLNIKNSISWCDLLFVEEIVLFEKLINENNIIFNWVLIESEKWTFNDTNYKKEIINYLLKGKNIWIFESSWTACFIDPWFEIINFLYVLKKKIDFNIIPISWTSALTTAISACWYNITNFIFLWFINKNSENEVLKSKIPIIYFNDNRFLEDLNINISFMNNITNKNAFIWINLWKKWLKYTNFLFRWNYKEVYEKINEMYLKDNRLDDITFIFE